MGLLAPKIVFYSHDGNSYGHISKISRLAGYLKDELPQASIFCISSSLYGFRFMPQCVDYLKLPSYTSTDTVHGIYSKSVSGLANEEFQDLRNKLLAGFFDSFVPDVLIMELLPGGRNNEMVPWLHKFKERSLLIWGLRGVIDEREAANLRLSRDKALFPLFDKIVVYNDKNVIDVSREYTPLNEFYPNIIYTGYVLKPHKKMIKTTDASKYVILTHIGGGGGGFPLLETIIHAKRFISTKKGVVLHVFTGDYITSDEFEILSKKASDIGGITINTFSSDILAGLYGADLFIGSGGYNALAEVVETDTPAIIIPKQISEKEQEIHASKLQQLGYVRHVYPPTVDAAELGKGISRVLEDIINPERIPLATDGGVRFAKLIVDLLGRC